MHCIIFVFPIHSDDVSTSETTATSFATRNYMWYRNIWGASPAWYMVDNLSVRPQALPYAANWNLPPSRHDSSSSDTYTWHTRRTPLPPEPLDPPSRDSADWCASGVSGSSLLSGTGTRWTNANFQFPGTFHWEEKR